MAIYNALLGVKDRLTAHVMGLAASMASVILMAAPVRIIHQGAMVMVHNPSGSAFGQADELRKTADTLDQIKGQMAAIYAAATGKDDGTVRKLMDDETWMGADEAVTQGFATEKDEEQVAASLRRAVAGKFRHVPPEIAIEETPTIRDAENALRDAGFPADRAKAILAVGFARDGQSGHRDDAEAAVIAALEDMNVRVEAW
jgi:ATP-dependent Clp protease protease subunit